MKALLTTLNSKYIHTAISIRYLKHYYDAFAVDLNTRVDMMEFTINNALDEIIERIALAEYDLVAFSCYIWNIEQTLKIAETLKKIQPTLRIVLGGPEVSHETEVLMHAHSAIDYVLIGEGEESFMQFIKAIERKTDFTEVNGLYYRNPLGIQKTPYDIARNAIIAERLPFPYESFEGLEHKILYYETSRGCPYNCKYCLSSTFKGVRYFPLEKVKRDLMRFINEGVMQVKFVDRTFNADRQRALEIMKFIAENDNGYTNFHLEITASLLDTATLDFLRTVRRELFQFEVGVQSTNEETLGAIDRHIPFEKIKETCLQIKSYENIHLHLDLIAGLPHEGFDSFMRSMDDLFSIRPEKIQLGFLKLLKGAQLRLQAEEYGMVYRDYPPYEILKTNWLSYGEMVRLKHIESLIDHYYNSGKFMFTLTYLASCSGKTFSEIMKGFSDVWEQNQWFDDKHALVTLYKRLYAYGQNMPGVESNFFKELLRFDYLRYNRKKGDDFFTVDYPESFKNRCHAYLQDEAHIAALLPRFVGKPAKTIMKQVHFEPFEYDVITAVGSNFSQIVPGETVILFDYRNRNKIFENHEYYKIVLEDDNGTDTGFASNE